MDKQILNAIAEVLKDERKRSSIEIGELVDSIPNYDQQLDDIEKALSEFSEFTAVKKEHDSFLAAEIERIHATINTKSESDSAIVSDLKKWASDFELKKEFEYLQFQDEFSELKEIALSVKDGENGEDGKDGTDGVDGRDGVDNPAIAPIHIDRNFKANKGLVVHHRGGLWQAIRNTNGDPEVDSGNWNCFVDGVTNVSSSFDPESALHSLHFEKTNGEKETISFERPPAYLPAGEHKSIDGDYVFDGTGVSVYVQGEWLGIDLKGEKGESGGRGRVGKRGVGVDDVISTQDGFTFLMTDGETKDVSFSQEIKDLIDDLIGTYSEEVDQEIKRYAGTWHSSKSYASGDVVTLTSALFLCLNNTSDSPESSDSWVQMTSQSGGGAYLSSDGGSGTGAIPDFVLTTESGTGGTHLSDFKESVSTLIKFVGVDENNRDVKATITTDMVQTNPLPFRNSKNGQFIGTPEELEQLTDQRKVNEFFYKTLGEIEAGDIDIPPSTIVSEDPPENPEEGMCWYDTGRLELFVFAENGWFPCSPLGARVEAGEIKQQAMVAQIEKSLQDQAKIVSKVEELTITKGAVSRYTVKGTEINVATRNGELYVNSPNAADVTYISFAPFDSNGQTTKPTNPEDIIEFVEAVGARNAGDVTRYKAISGDSNALTVEYLSGVNDFEVDEAEEVYIYPQNKEGVSQDYVDEGLASKLNNLGSNQLPDDTDWKIKQLNAEGKNKTLIHTVGGALGVYNLKEPVESHHAATKSYVDAKSSENSGISAFRPPGLKFMCSIVNLPNGYFQWWVKESTGNQHLEIATTDRDGIAWGTNTPREDVRYSDNVPFTIWEVSGGGWKMRVTGTISRIDFHPDHALCYVSSKTDLNGGNFANGSGPYYITIGGIF